jgi:uncharacterized protein (DUF433 family)
MQSMESPTTPAAATGPTSLADFIVKTPGVCGGQPRIAGTRIKVKHVYTWVERMGMTPARVVAEYPHLTRAQVHAALAYYWSHPDEIHRDMEDEEKLVAELKAKAGPSLLQERLAEGDAATDPLPLALFSAPSRPARRDPRESLGER